jgi:transposase-like protein
MPASSLSDAALHDEAAALAHLEAVLWPNGPVCPHCGATDRIYTLKGKSTRLGVRKCGHCLKPFTVTVGTLMERSHVPLHKWVQAITLLTCSKKGISAHQLHRVLRVSYPTAWFMAHRIREAMREGALDVFGGNGAAVEVDETFIGNDRAIKPKGEKKGRGYAHKHKVLSLVDRTKGKARSMVVDDLKAETLVPILRENIAAETRVMTDEAGQYVNLRDDFAEHGVVRHGAGEYVDQDDETIHTNTVEGYFSVFKRGMKGVYQHCTKKHLHRYLAEFDFRYNHRSALGVEDAERANRALQGIVGKRLTYRRADQSANPR